jgi:poly-gamma-glutamate synthesis protein (capsule biosynthesis protein)
MICNNLRAQGAEIIIMSIHWGDEGTYLPIEHQVELGHWAIDAGVDIVYGHHSHTLMPIETYNGGIIYYSLANFSFGGNRNPVDKDTAIIQQQIIRDEEGNISLGETIVIPCRVSTKDSWNDYCPTPYEPGSHEYNRVMAKIEGSWDGTP